MSRNMQRRQEVVSGPSKTGRAHLVSDGPPGSPALGHELGPNGTARERGAALRIGLKELAHPAAGGTPLSNRIDPPPADSQS